MKRFSEIIELDRDQIITDPKLFQGRQNAYSEETVNSIISKGYYDKSAEPIVVWEDPSRGKYIVISGHSRWEGSSRLYKSGKQSDLKKMPVKVFLGDLEDAIDYATLESNRASTEEGLISDLQAYRRAISKGFNKAKLLAIFKPESKLQKLKELSYLNPKGQFVQELSKSSSRSFPYLERNARWVGQIRKVLPQLSDAHETELFNYFYKGKQANLKLTKDKFFDLVDKRVNRIDFNADSALNLENRVSSSALTDPINDQIKEIEQDISRFQKRIEKKRESLVLANADVNLPNRDTVISNIKKEIGNYESAILRKMEEQNTLRQQKGKIERETVVDLFSASQEDPKPKAKDSDQKVAERIKAKAESRLQDRKARTNKPYKVGDLVNVTYGDKKHLGAKIIEESWHDHGNNFFGQDKWVYKVQLSDGKTYWDTDQNVSLNPYDSSEGERGQIVNPFPLLDPDQTMYKTASRAWSWSSMRPESRGAGFMIGHEYQLKQYLEEFEKVAKQNGTQNEVKGIFNQFAKKYRDFANDYLYRQSNIASSMVTGPANFPVARNEKRVNAQHNLQLKWDEWEKKAVKRILKELRNEPVATGNPTDELARQKAKLKNLQDLQVKYRAINTAYRQFKRNPSSLDQSDLPESIKEMIRTWKPEFSYEKAPIAPYQMSNNNANIKRVEERVRELEMKSKIAESGQNPEHAFEGGTVVLNAPENRIQIFFDDKPGPDLRNELKKSGFKWAPSKKAWQRMITDNAIMKTAWLSFIKVPYESLFKSAKEEPKPAPKDEEPKRKQIYPDQLTARILETKPGMTVFSYAPGKMAEINKHGTLLVFDDKEKRFTITGNVPKELYEKARDTASNLKFFPPKNEGVKLKNFSDKGSSRTYYDYSALVGRDIIWKNKGDDTWDITVSKPIEKPKAKIDLKEVAQSLRKVLNVNGGNSVKVSTHTSNEFRSNHHIKIEMRDGSPLDERTKNILEGFNLDKNQVHAYGMMIYVGQAQKVIDSIRSMYIHHDYEGSRGCPPKMKDGKLAIDEGSILKLEECIKKQTQTKDLHTDKKGNYSPDRLALHAKIIGEFKKGAECRKGEKPIAILTGGAPGSGKSTFLKNYAPWLLSDKVYHIDADEVRAKLPEYEGWNASATHEETSDITKKLIEGIGKPCEYDLIYDGTMNKAKKYKPLVKQLKDLGYEVHVIYLQVPEEVSRKRVLERYQRSGRYVPMQVIDEIYEKGLEAYEEVIKSADGFIRVDGVSQEIIEKGGKSLPKRRTLSKAKEKQVPTQKDQQEAETIRKEIRDYVTLSKEQVSYFAEKLNSLRKVSSQINDSSRVNKKVVPLTAEGLFRWAKNPGAYDLPGIDAPENAKPTVKPRKIKKLEKPNKSAANFWQKIWNG